MLAMTFWKTTFNWCNDDSFNEPMLAKPIKRQIPTSSGDTPRRLADECVGYDWTKADNLPNTKPLQFSKS